MSELQEVTTTDLENSISPDNDSIILSEKDEDSDFDEDLDNSIIMPGNENIVRVPPRPPIDSENYVIENNAENNDDENNIIYERDQIANTDDEDEDEDDDNENKNNSENADKNTDKPENVIISTEEANNLVASEDEDEDETDSEDEDNETYQKLDHELDRDILLEYHPEAKYSSYNEVLAQSKIVRNKNGEIIDELHTTLPFLTKYEKARILGLRAKQINNGSEPFVNIPNNVIDGSIIAEMELKQNKIPFIIRRPIPNGGSEYWKISDLELLED